MQPRRSEPNPAAQPEYKPVEPGSAAPADFQQGLNDAVTVFVVDKNVDAFANALVAAAQSSGFGQ